MQSYNQFLVFTKQQNLRSKGKPPYKFLGNCYI